MACNLSSARYESRIALPISLRNTRNSRNGYASSKLSENDGFGLDSIVLTLWLDRVAATIYHLFLAEDNSPELFAQAKRMHSLVPYTALKQVIRFANPAAVMKGVLDLFLAQPLGARSLMQRIFGLAINDGIKTTQKAIELLQTKIDDPVLCEKVRHYTEADEAIKQSIRDEAVQDQVDLIVVILRSEHFAPELQADQIGRIFNAFVAWNNVVDNVCCSSGRRLIRGMNVLTVE